MKNEYPITRTMNQKDIFDLAVRLIGLWLIFLAIKSIPAVFDYFGALVSIALYFATGWWFVGGASLLTKRAFPTSILKSKDTGEVVT